MTPTESALEQAQPAQPVQERQIVVLIHRDKEGNWTIGPKDEESNKRFLDHDSKEKDEYNTFDGRWRNRHGKPRKDDDDVPIFFLEGDVFHFQCEGKGDLPFGIGATKNPNVQALPGAPDDPFESWEGGRAGLDGTWISAGKPLTATVKTSDGKVPGVKAQRFYKFHGWVLVDGEFTPVDPDGYCGG